MESPIEEQEVITVWQLLRYLEDYTAITIHDAGVDAALKRLDMNCDTNLIYIPQ